MPWQGDLFIGVEVSGEEEAIAVYEELGIPVGKVKTSGFGQEATFMEDVFSGSGVEKTVTFRGKPVRVYLYAMIDGNNSDSFAVGFGLTGRYKGHVLDKDEPKGRPEVFTFDPEDLCEILREVRTWWPKAGTFIWDRFH